MKEMDISEYSYKNGRQAAFKKAIDILQQAQRDITIPYSDFDWGRKQGLSEAEGYIREEMRKRE